MLLLTNFSGTKNDTLYWISIKILVIDYQLPGCFLDISFSSDKSRYFWKPRRFRPPRAKGGPKIQVLSFIEFAGLFLASARPNIRRGISTFPPKKYGFHSVLAHVQFHSNVKDYSMVLEVIYGLRKRDYWSTLRASCRSAFSCWRNRFNRRSFRTFWSRLKRRTFFVWNVWIESGCGWLVEWQQLLKTCTS